MNDQPTPGRRPDGFNDEDLCKPFQWIATPASELERSDACIWTHHRSYGGDYTECGEWFYLAHEWTEKFKFCPYCGGRISLASEKEGGE
jgi:hypothetical protein